MKKILCILLFVGLLIQGSMDAACEGPSQQDQEIADIFHKISRILMKWHDTKRTFNDWYGDESEADYYKIGEEKEKAAKINPEMLEFTDIWLNEYDNPYFFDNRLFETRDYLARVSDVATLLFQSRPLTEQGSHYILRLISQIKNPANNIKTQPGILMNSATAQELMRLRDLKLGRVQAAPPAPPAPSPLAGGGIVPAAPQAQQSFRLSQALPAPTRQAPRRPTVAAPAPQRQAPTEGKRRAASEQEQRALLKEIDAQFKAAMKNTPPDLGGMEAALQRFLDNSKKLDAISDQEKTAFAAKMSQEIDRETERIVQAHASQRQGPARQAPTIPSEPERKRVTAGAGSSVTGRPSITPGSSFTMPPPPGMAEELRRVQRSHREGVPQSSGAWTHRPSAVQPSFTQQQKYENLVRAIEAAIARKNATQIREALRNFFEEAKTLNQIEKNKIKADAQRLVENAKNGMSEGEGKLVDRLHNIFLKEFLK